MLWIDAKKLGESCGLETDEECLANIEIHAMNLFEYSKIATELEELWKDYHDAVASQSSTLHSRV